MSNKIIKLALAVILPFVVLFSFFLPAYATLQQGYIISSYDVDVKILKDGTLDISEKVKYSYLGNSNNAIILIDKQEGEEIEIINVYTLKNSQYIKCERLSAGQWDANVFTGTYSAVEESDLVRLKIYGSYKNQQATFLVQYRVKNAIKRYRDIAEYKRTHVFENWDGYISNININVRLPKFTNHESIKAFLHGVLVGQKDISERKYINYRVPSTVPGEYVEARIAFPEYLVSDAPVTEDVDYAKTLIDEEKEYSESDKSDLLRARENYAKEAGRIAWNEKVSERTKLFFAIISLFASYLGLLTIFRTGRELKTDKEAFELKDITLINPSETGLLLSGRTGARAFVSGLLDLVNKEVLYLEINGDEPKPYLSFIVSEENASELMEDSEKYLLNCVKDMSGTSGSFTPQLISKKRGSHDSSKLFSHFKIWSETVRNSYSEKNTLNPGQLYYRNLGLIMGVVLFAAGCIVPVSLSIWSGYVMLPVGFLLFWYALNIHRRTKYRIIRRRALKTLKTLVDDKSFNINTLPDSLSDPSKLLIYGLALGVESKLSITKSSLKIKSNSISTLSDDIYQERIKDILVKTVISINDALVSNIDY